MSGLRDRLKVWDEGYNAGYAAAARELRPQTTDGIPDEELLKAAEAFAYENRGCDERWIAAQVVKRALASLRGNAVSPPPSPREGE